jgi:tRNA threonylcarbamoyladenosine biosynthesis protein TsaE
MYYSFVLQIIFVQNYYNLFMYSITYNINDIDIVAQQVIDTIMQNNAATCVCLIGNMGAGKTTLVKAMVKALGVTDNVSSPTYAIINQYQNINNKPIYHLDIYRVKSIDEAIEAGVEDVILSNNICFIEWPQLIMPLLPNSYWQIEISLISTQERVISVENIFIAD